LDGSNVWNEGGTIVGRAELVPESERAGQKEGPFAGFEGAKVTKEGLVVDSTGVTIGRLIQGDGKQLYGKEVDADGDVSVLNPKPFLGTESNTNVETIRFSTKMGILSAAQRDGSQKRNRRHTTQSLAERSIVREMLSTRMVM
jgi:hypothetical protein